MSTAQERNVQVWDWPTRIFHWSLLALVLVAWFTGEEDGLAVLIHRVAGEAIAGLVVFRVIWGFVGGEHARFADFAAGPAAIVAHLRDLFSTRPKRHLGHNPLGGVAVFLLLALVLGIVITGLFSGGQENAGPLAGFWGPDLTDAHEILFRALQALVVVHVLGVIVESVKAKDALVPAMITGSKRRRADEPGEAAKRASLAALLLALALGAGAAAALMNLPPSASAANESRDDNDGMDHD